MKFTCVVTLDTDGIVRIIASRTMTDWMSWQKYEVKGVVIRHNDKEATQ